MSVFPPPPNTKIKPKPTGELSESETTFILRTTLQPHHYADPFVVRFIARYMQCRDARQAAQDVGLQAREGQNLKERPDIWRCLCALSEKSALKFGFDASEIVERVKEITFIDPIEFVRADGSFKHLNEMTPEARRTIKKFKVKNEYGKDPNGMPIIVGEVLEFELYDRMKGAELLGRETGTFKETKRVEHDVTEDMANVLLGSAERGQQRLLSAADENVIDVTPAKEG